MMLNWLPVLPVGVNGVFGSLAGAEEAKREVGE